jgi:tetratricopeptide (TPR) repeat protein
MNQTDDVDGFLYEDIAFARSVNMSDEEFLLNSHAFIQYCSVQDNNNNDDEDDEDDEDDDDDDDDNDDDENEPFIDEKMSYVIDAWAELGYKYFYQNHNAKQALECYTREKELSLINSKLPSTYFNPLIGSCSERMGDIYASKNDIEKALALYNEALDLSRKETFVNNAMAAARCMCKIGRYNPNHEPELFHDAFKDLIYGYGKPYTRDTIGKCYVYLARSLQRCERYQQALKYAKQAISIFLPDPLLLERLIDDCCQLLIELHQSINNSNDNVPTKEKLLSDRISSNDEQIKAMLQTTLEELKSELENKTR